MIRTIQEKCKNLDIEEKKLSKIIMDEFSLSRETAIKYINMPKEDIARMDFFPSRKPLWTIT